MYRIYLLLLSALLVFASCSEHPQFVRNDIQVCQTEGFTGYFVPDGIGSHGLLYVDRGKLYAEEHRVEISKRFGKTYVKGEERILSPRVWIICTRIIRFPQLVRWSMARQMVSGHPILTTIREIMAG